MVSRQESDLEMFSLLIIGVMAGVFLVAVLWNAGALAADIFRGINVQTIDSKMGHRAELLKKHNLADMNFIVRMDGRKIFESPDLAGCSQNACREFLLFDDNGEVIVLNVVGKNIFAYDAKHDRELGKGELARYKFSMPGYEQNLLRDIDQ
jgi:hypothetical protein